MTLPSVPKGPPEKTMFYFCLQGDSWSKKYLDLFTPVGFLNLSVFITSQSLLVFLSRVRDIYICTKFVDCFGNPTYVLVQDRCMSFLGLLYTKYH